MNLLFITNQELRDIPEAIKFWQGIESSVYEKRVDIGEENRLVQELLKCGDVTTAIGWLRRN
mgnify:CR=1 FL=1